MTDKNSKYRKRVEPRTPMAEARVKLGYSQTELGKACGITHGAISGYETGATETIPAKIAKDLVDILGVTMEVLRPGFQGIRAANMSARLEEGKTAMALPETVHPSVDRMASMQRKAAAEPFEPSEGEMVSMMEELDLPLPEPEVATDGPQRSDDIVLNLHRDQAEALARYLNFKKLTHSVADDIMDEEEFLSLYSISRNLRDKL